MDPNETLAEIRRLVRVIGTPAADEAGVEALRLAELVEGLDNWLSRGGFLPDKWERARDKA